MKSLLIVEDDKTLNMALKIFFEKNHYQVSSALTLNDAVTLISSERFDLIISDIALPDGTGLRIPDLLHAKNDSVPVLFLTAKDDEEEIIKGYEAGCLDYITKPINPEILKRKVDAILGYNNAVQEVVTYKEIKFDLGKKKLWLNSEEVRLTPKEFHLMELFAANQGKVLTKEILLSKVWDIDGDFVGENTVSVTVNRLRRKISDDNDSPKYIKTIFGLGYVFGD